RRVRGALRRRQPARQDVRHPRRHRRRRLLSSVRSTPRLLRRPEEALLEEEGMTELYGFVAALRVGGMVMVPLLALALVAGVVILEQAFVFAARTRLPTPGRRIGAPTRVPAHERRRVAAAGFAWEALQQRLEPVDLRNYFRRFFAAILAYRT